MGYWGVKKSGIWDIGTPVSPPPPLYAQIRVVMLDSISHIKPDIAPGLSLLLRGDINLTFDQNKAIFEYVQAFIRTSSRF